MRRILLFFIFIFPFIIQLQAQTALISDSVDITHYEINLDMSRIGQKQISGFAELSLTPVQNPIMGAALYLLHLDIDSIQYNNQSIANFSYNDTIIELAFPSALQLNDTAYVTVYYHGHPVIDPSGWGGFYFTNDSSFAYNMGVGFQDKPHNYGRVWFPCIDDFIDRAVYDMKIRTRLDQMAVCNGLLVGDYCAGNNTHIYHWRLNQTIPTYLANVAVGDYYDLADTLIGLADTVPIKLFIRPQDTNKARGSFANLKNILHIYESYFGPYAWDRVGYVGVPFNSGAMEHSTNISYPNFAINGALTYESLMAHELSHQWFGDMMTCISAEEMWINEGWAVFSEMLYREPLYGIESYKNIIRVKHADVLRIAHIDDGAYRALANMPHEYTYGTTTYDKGGCVVHTLRNYLGDSLFFPAVQNMLKTFAFNHISSAQMRDYLESHTGRELDEFFDTWVFEAGFPHFSIDSLIPWPMGSNSDHKIFVRQESKGTNHVSNDNIVDITFFDGVSQFHTDTMKFSGNFGEKVFTVPFIPAYAMIDFHEKICDATVDKQMWLKNSGVQEFLKTYCYFDVQTITDSVFARVTHNWVGPDPLQTPITGLQIADHRYWTVEGSFPSGFHAKARFYFNKFQYLDPNFITNSADSIVLLYRPNRSSDWEFAPFVRTGGNSSGYIIADTVSPGEYALAIWDHDASTGEYIKQENRLKVYPNPSANTFSFSFNTENPLFLRIYSSDGKLLHEDFFENGSGNMEWEPKVKNNSVYVAVLQEPNNKIIAKQKLVYVP